MDAMLRALADGRRRQILALVWLKERTAGAIAAEFAVTRPAISRHLAVLVASELLTVRRAGTRRFYRVNRLALGQLRAQLEPFWNDRLLRLKHAVEAAEWKKRRRRPKGEG